MKKVIAAALLTTLLSALLLPGCSSLWNLPDEWKSELKSASRADETTPVKPSEQESKTPSESAAPASAEPSAPVLPEIGETPELEVKGTEEENLDDLDVYIAALEKGLVDEEGYVLNDQALHMLVDRFYEDAQKAVEKGVYQATLKDEEKVFVLLNSGVVYLYEPYKRGFLSGGGPEGGLKILVVNSYANEVDFQKTDKRIHPKGYKEIMDELKDTRKEVSFETYENMGCTAEAYEKLAEPGKRIICLGGHGIPVDLSGGVNEYMMDSFATLIVSGIKYEKGQESVYQQLGLYPEERETGFVATFKRTWQGLLVKGDVVINQKRYLCLTPNFFRNLADHRYLDDSIVILDSCSSAKNGLENDTIQALLEKGADMVVGYSDDVELIYDYALNGAFLEGILDKNNEEKSFEEVLQIAKGKAEEVDNLLHEDTHLIMDEKNNYIDDWGIVHNCEAQIFGEWADKTVREWKDKEKVRQDAYTFYHAYLDQHQAFIGHRFTNPSDPLNGAVAFADIWGDDMPEMLFMMERDADWQPGVRFYSDLFVMTWQNGAAWWVTDGGLLPVGGTAEALAESLTYQIADGGRFAVYENKNDKGIRLFTISGDTTVTHSYYIYQADDINGLVIKEDLFKQVAYNGSKQTAKYWTSKMTLMEEAFNNGFSSFSNPKNIGALLLSNLNNYPGTSLPAEQTGGRPNAELTCKEALAYLESLLDKYAKSKKLYADILGYLTEQVQEGWKNEDRERSFKYSFDEYYYKTGGELGYSFVDLNEDGNDELVILQRKGDGEILELVLYTFRNGNMVCIERNSAHYYFRMNADKTVLRGDIYEGEQTYRLDENGAWVKTEGKKDRVPMEFEFVGFGENGPA